jgi:iron complex transport system permease protein
MGKAAGQRRLFWAIGLLGAAVVALSVLLGRYPGPFLMLPERLAGDALAQKLVLNLRLPRLVAALLLGASLSATGFAFQMIFDNPLVEPGFLGVSQGAAFGAALSIVTVSSAPAAVQLSAALFGFLGLGLSYFLARRVRFGGWVLRLVLAGIAVSAMFSAGSGILKYLADPTNQLAEITFWLLGGLWSVTWDKVLSILPAVIIGLAVLFRMRWRVNLLSLSDETAFSLGAAPTRERAIVLVAGVLATSAVISVAGMVGWIGLIVPHIARRLFGADSRFALPGSMLVGALFALLCDDLGRTLTAGEIPLGILTSLIGAALFMWLMSQRQGAKQS